MEDGITIDGYIRHLQGLRKKNGDKLLPITIERYAYFLQSYLIQLNDIAVVEPLVEKMNELIKQRPSIILFAALRHYLTLRGFELHAKLVKSPPENPHAASSIRYLQGKVLSYGELRQMMSDPKANTADRLTISALYDSACRRAEYASIKMGHIRFMNPSIPDDRIEMSQGIYAKINILGKGHKSREVYFSRTTVKLIHELTKGKFHSDAYLVNLLEQKEKPDRNRDKLLYHRLVQLHEKILNRHVHPHCYRHTRLTHMCDAGVELIKISRYAGHASVKTTEIYLHISSFAGNQAFKQSRDILGGHVNRDLALERREQLEPKQMQILDDRLQIEEQKEQPILDRDESETASGHVGSGKFEDEENTDSDHI
jgi:integrase